MIAQSTLISYHTEAFVKTEVACTVCVYKSSRNRTAESDHGPKAMSHLLCCCSTSAATAAHYGTARRALCGTVTHWAIIIKKHSIDLLGPFVSKKGHNRDIKCKFDILEKNSKGDFLCKKNFHLRFCSNFMCQF